MLTRIGGSGVFLEPVHMEEVTVSSLLHLFAFMIGPLNID